MKTNNFDNISGIYDFLARLVFGTSIVESQCCHLNYIRPGSKVLIVGGGTGWILTELDKHVESAEVVYVEPSAKMMHQSKGRGPFRNLKVEFVNDNHQIVSQYGRFDYIMTHFFLDIFEESQLEEVMVLLQKHLHRGGSWSVVDFVKNGNLLSRALISFMYIFFRITARLEGKKLMDFQSYFERINMIPVTTRQFFRGMIRSTIYRMN